MFVIIYLFYKITITHKIASDGVANQGNSPIIRFGWEIRVPYYRNSIFVDKKTLAPPIQEIKKKIIHWPPTSLIKPRTVPYHNYSCFNWANDGNELLLKS